MEDAVCKGGLAAPAKYWWVGDPPCNILRVCILWNISFAVCHAASSSESSFSIMSHIDGLPASSTCNGGDVACVLEPVCMQLSASCCNRSQLLRFCTCRILSANKSISHCFHFESALSAHCISHGVNLDFTFDLNAQYMFPTMPNADARLFVINYLWSFFLLSATRYLVSMPCGSFLSLKLHGNINSLFCSLVVIFCSPFCFQVLDLTWDGGYDGTSQELHFSYILARKCN